GLSVLPLRVPSRRPELPGDLKRDHGLARAGRHREEGPLPTIQDRFDGPVDGDFLIVPGLFARLVEERCQEGLRDRLGEPLPHLVACPQLIWCGESLDELLLAGEEVILDDVRAVRGVCELETQNLRILFRLLEAVAGWSLVGLRLDDAKGDVAGVA